MMMIVLLVFRDPAGGLSLQSIIDNNQWFMVFALVFFLLYNGKRGRSLKAFFYIYYPAHVFILLALAHLLYRAAAK